MSMPRAFHFGSASQALPRLLHHVMTSGSVRESRVGLTRELNDVQLTLLDPFPFEITTPGRRVSLPAQIAETMWILSGRNDIEWLSTYLPRAAEFSDDGKTWRGGYGPRLRGFAANPDESYSGVDQLAHVVSLLRTDPDTRRAVFNIYDPAIDTEPGKDIPCNNWVHFLLVDGRLNATVAIRSNDLMWGWSGINSFEWSALLHIVAKLAGLTPGRITFNISSLHLYERHFDKAERIVAKNKELQVLNFGVENPEFAAPGNSLDPVGWLDSIIERWFAVEQMIREGHPSADKEINRFPEPMLQSWLHVLRAWHLGDPPAGMMPPYLWGTSLQAALATSPAKPVASPEPAPAVDGSFLAYVQGLHAEKDAVYGDSWCRRGEQMAIMANIARKVDRLGVAGAGDTASDTALDMAVYLVKYSIWHDSHKQGRREVLPLTGPEHVALVNKMLAQISDTRTTRDTEALILSIKSRFDTLESLVKANTSRGAAIQNLAQMSWVLASRLWEEEKQANEKTEAWKAGNATRPFNGYNDPEEG